MADLLVTPRSQRNAASLTRCGLLLAYLAGVVFGLLKIWGSWPHGDAPSADPVSSRKMPAGHRLLAGDLKTAAIGQSASATAPATGPMGKYLLRGVAPDMPIVEGNLASIAPLRLAAGRFAFPISLQKQPELADVLDAGTAVVVCSGGDCPVGLVRVAAVPCKDSSCSAVLDVSEAQFRVLCKLDANAIRIMLAGVREIQ